jgi:hypothetical protein
MVLGGSNAFLPYSLDGISAIDAGLASTGGLLPGWQLAQQVAPGGFDPNFYRTTTTSSSPAFISTSGIGTFGSDILTGSWASDYVSSYNWTTQEIDIVAGNYGSDLFVLGDWYGIHYQFQSLAIVADFNPYEGDAIQLSSQGSGYYSLGYGDALGTGALDTILFYGTDAIGVFVDSIITEYDPVFYFV